MVNSSADHTNQRPEMLQIILMLHQSQVWPNVRRIKGFNSMSRDSVLFFTTSKVKYYIRNYKKWNKPGNAYSY